MNAKNPTKDMRIIAKTITTRLDVFAYCLAKLPIRNSSLFWIASTEWFASLNAVVASFPALSKISPYPPGCELM